MILYLNRHASNSSSSSRNILAMTLHYAGVSWYFEHLKYLLGTFCWAELVFKIKSILSITFHTICGAVCFKLTHFSYDDCENMCTSSYNHHQIGSKVWPICHCLWLRNETMILAGCLSVFLFHYSCQLCDYWELRVILAGTPVIHECFFLLSITIARIFMFSYENVACISCGFDL